MRSVAVYQELRLPHPVGVSAPVCEISFKVVADERVVFLVKLQALYQTCPKLFGNHRVAVRHEIDKIGHLKKGAFFFRWPKSRNAKTELNY
jgi:hypothetical protein